MVRWKVRLLQLGLTMKNSQKYAVKPLGSNGAWPCARTRYNSVTIRDSSTSWLRTIGRPILLTAFKGLFRQTDLCKCFNIQLFKKGLNTVSFHFIDIESWKVYFLPSFGAYFMQAKKTVFSQVLKNLFMQTGIKIIIIHQWRS